LNGSLCGYVKRFKPVFDELMNIGNLILIVGFLPEIRNWDFRKEDTILASIEAQKKRNSI